MLACAITRQRETLLVYAIIEQRETLLAYAIMRQRNFVTVSAIVIVGPNRNPQTYYRNTKCNFTTMIPSAVLIASTIMRPTAVVLALPV